MKTIIIGPYKFKLCRKIVAEIQIDSKTPLTQKECNLIFRQVGTYLHKKHMGKHWHFDIYCEAGCNV